MFNSCESIFITFLKLAFYNDAQTALATDERQEKNAEMTTFQKVWLYTKRSLAWIFVGSVTGGFVAGIYFLYGYANDSATKEECPSFDSLAIGKSLKMIFLTNFY